MLKNKTPSKYPSVLDYTSLIHRNNDQRIGLQRQKRSLKNFIHLCGDLQCNIRFASSTIKRSLTPSNANFNFATIRRDDVNAKVKDVGAAVRLRQCNLRAPVQHGGKPKLNVLQLCYLLTA